MANKNYYYKLDLVRVMACIAILFYHLDILPGGYLAVCIFFLISGYLTTRKALEEENFSFKKYYLNKLLRIYIPLLIVVFISIAIISFIPSINWLNLKPETTSVILGYNNFWQLSVNLDYFARHIDSPFMHLWYTSILIQFDLIFPFIFKLFKVIEKKINKYIPGIITFILTIISAILFLYYGKYESINFTYYNTFTRLFSLLLGVSLGYFHEYHKPLVIKNKILYYLYFIICILLFIFIDSNSRYMLLSMLIISIITLRLIDYSIFYNIFEIKENHKLINYISSISYEVFLIQYPVIYLFQFININNYLKIFLIIIIVIILASILHYIFNFKDSNRSIRFIILEFIILLVPTYGMYIYIGSIDHTDELIALEKELANNEKVMLEYQKKYQLEVIEEENNLQKKLSDLELTSEELKEKVTNLKVTGIGDSVMLGAVDNLYEAFPNSYFDAAISRTAWVVGDLLKEIDNKNMLGEVILLNLGANGDCPTKCKENIMAIAGDRLVFWVNVTNDSSVHVNDSLNDFALKHDNLHIIDWNGASAGHSEYFVVDGIHLTKEGRIAYANAIYEAIYNTYASEVNKEKENLIKEHEILENNKITMYGNSILLNNINYLKEEFNNASLLLSADYNYETLIDYLNNNTLTKNILIAFDKSVDISKEEYNNIIDLCKDSNLYIVISNNIDITSNRENVTIINFYDELIRHDNYLMSDQIHLSVEGNEALTKLLISYLKN